MSSTREHFRGVIWPREPKPNDGQQAYRYLVVGMLVTNRPLDVHPNETAIDGALVGMAEALEKARRVELGHKLGDAADVLLSLNTAWPEPEEPSASLATEGKARGEPRDAARTIEASDIIAYVRAQGWVETNRQCGPGQRRFESTHAEIRVGEDDDPALLRAHIAFLARLEGRPPADLASEIQRPQGPREGTGSG